MDGPAPEPRSSFPQSPVPDNANPATGYLPDHPDFGVLDWKPDRRHGMFPRKHFHGPTTLTLAGDTEH